MDNLGFFFFGLAAGVAVTAATTYFVNSYVVIKTASKRSASQEPTFVHSRDASSKPANRKPTDVSQEDLESGSSSLTRGHTHNRASSTNAILPRLESQLTVSTSRLHNMVLHMTSEFKKGLSKDGENVKMIPSFVVERPKGIEMGTFLALDMGGSNFRVCFVSLEGQGHIRVNQRKHVISDELKQGPGVALFDFFADCVQSFLNENGGTDSSKPIPLGFTFSFPVNQTAIDQGFLIQWNKGFKCEGVINKDVVVLLQEAFYRKNLNVQVKAVVNDTVGTLIAHAYKDPQTMVGVILGTGTNAAYVEKIENVPKWNGEKPSSGEMIINTEWGAYDEPTVLPITSYDLALDRASSNPKKQIFEKMISGMYLGEITRLILVDLVNSGELFNGTASADLNTPFHFDTAYMSRIERDHNIELNDTKRLLEDVLKIPSTTVEDRRIVKQVCELIGTRSARLSAAAIAALVSMINRLDSCTVAIDGSLFEHYPHFANRMRDALREILGLSAENILLEKARDGSGQGAALIAALH